MAMGYMGPSNIPMKATVMAFPTNDGTNQTTNSRLRDVSISFGKHTAKLERYAPQRKERVEVEHPVLAYPFVEG